MRAWTGCFWVFLWGGLFLFPMELPRAWAQAIFEEQVEETPTTSRPSLKLSRPDSSTRTENATRRAANGGWGTTVSGLSIVLALVGVGAFFLRKQMPRLAGILPGEVIHVLGKRYLDQRQCIQLVRIGNRILVLGSSTQHGLRTLTEITDPVEVDQLAGQCAQARPYSASQNFSTILSQQEAASNSISPQRVEDAFLSLTKPSTTNSGRPHV